MSDWRDAAKAILTAAPDRANKVRHRHLIGVEGGVRIRRKGIARWPIHSEASAVHPEQREELMRFYESQGVPTYVDENGCPVYTSARHRKRACEARGFIDRNGGYSDPVRRDEHVLTPDEAFDSLFE